MPPTRSTARTHMGETCGSAPHQLCAVGNTYIPATRANAAGLNTFAVRVRIRYLLDTATTDSASGTYQCSCARTTIVTIIAVSTAPLGNCQIPRRSLRMHTSTTPAITAADPMLSATASTPSPGAAIAVRHSRTMVSSPLGVLKKRNALCTAQARRAQQLKAGSDDESFHAHAHQQGNALLRIENERGRGQRVRQHRAGRHDGGARDAARCLAAARIQNVLPALVGARGADGPVRDA